MIVRVVLLPVAALLLAAEPALPQPGPAPPPSSAPVAPSPPIDARTRQLVIDSAGRLLIDGYVYEDRGRDYAAKLTAFAAAGRYDSLNDRDSFARALTRDLREISNDRHLRVMPDTAMVGMGPRFVRSPGTGGPGGSAPVMRRMSPGGEPPPGGPLGPGGGSPAGAPPPGGPRGPGGPPPDARMAPKLPPGVVNDGFARIEMLEGRIGYLDLRGFHGTMAGRARVDSMMKAFAGAQAMVIDLGRNGGGDGMMVGYLSTYFFDRPVHLVSQQMRGEPEPLERWTEESVPGPRFKGPVYVLISPRTFSAAEAFAFGMRINDRVTLVGEKTGGGGHFGGVEALAAGFSLWLPRGRTYDPRTGKGWEADGVTPDVAVPYDQALDKALALARAGH